MCSGVESDTPGHCSKCGMALAKNPHSATGKRYVCPMHPEITSDKPGNCPICGMSLELAAADLGHSDTAELRDMTRRFWIGAFLSIPVLLLAMGEMIPGLDGLVRLLPPGSALWIQFALSTPVFFWAGWPFLQRAWESIVNRSPNMFTLIALGTSAAYFFSVAGLLFGGAQHHAAGGHVYFEAAAVITALALLGQVLELQARSHTGSAIRSLLKLAPDIAHRVADGQEQDVPLEHIQTGDLLRVRPGERIPVDGTLVEGRSEVDESMLTGEPISVVKVPGQPVTSGSLNGSGSFVFQAERVGKDTMLSQIVELVAKAQRSQAPIQRIADRVAGWFVPAVLVISVLTFSGWILFGPEPRLAFAVTSAVGVLIIACPCALGLATPMAVMVGIGRAAQLGILVREAAVIEKLEEVVTMALDKTGTLTQGKPAVVDVAPFKPFGRAELLRLAAATEAPSEHPIARAIVRAAEGQLLPAATDFDAEAGTGVTATVEDRTVRVVKLSNGDGFRNVERQIADRWRKEGKTVVRVEVAGEPAGLIAVADPIKRGAKEAVQELLRLKLKPVMLTGDNHLTARYVAEQLGIESVVADLSPAQKQAEISRLKDSGAKVAMVGDGINDAPALATADVGIAMGAGTEVAIQSAQITLVRDDPRTIVSAILLSRATMRNIRENLVFAFAYNLIGVPIAAGLLYPAFGITLNPMIGSAAMSLSSVSVIANALRLRRKGL
jgi:Cu+-exporting ATPase